MYLFYLDGHVNTPQKYPYMRLDVLASAAHSAWATRPSGRAAVPIICECKMLESGCPGEWRLQPYRKTVSILVPYAIQKHENWRQGIEFCNPLLLGRLWAKTLILSDHRGSYS